jgi:uncharacterized protein (DUF2267 family)
MKLLKAILLIVLVAMLASTATYVISTHMHVEEQNSFRNRLSELEEKLNLVCLLDAGNSERARSLLNAEIDMWIVNRTVDARKWPWIKPDMASSPETRFLARVARQRELHPLTYDSSEVSSTINEVLSAALSVERNQEETIEPSIAH